MIQLYFFHRNVSVYRINMYFKTFSIVCFVVLFAPVHPSAGPKKKCPCTNKAQCEPVTDWHDDMREIMVITNRSSDYQLWMWDSLTTVLEWNDDINSTLTDHLMCYAHAQGKKYGFYINKLPTLTEATSVATEISYKRADVVAINLVDYLGNCSYAAHHVTEIINRTTSVLSVIKKDIDAKLLCVMPWKPPCYEMNCDVGSALAKQCDAIIFSPESYNTYCAETCTAKPTVSYSKIVIGITEYISVGFSPAQLLLGIPWHGYNYTCQNTDHVDDWTGHFVCHLNKKTDNATGKEICDIEGSRVKVSIGSVVGKVPEVGLLDATYSKPDQSPYRVNKDGTGNNTRQYMAWFEDIGSLLAKYEAVGIYNLKGGVIFSGDDLTYDHVKTNKEFDNHMWAWMLHAILSTGNEKKVDRECNMAGTVAGVGVGLFVLGCLLGTLINCIIFRRNRTLHAPFKHDQMTDEYTDDDHNQL